MSKKKTQSIRQEYCKLKGWNFIELEDAIQVQEYAIFLESQLAEKDKEIEKWLNNFEKVYMAYCHELDNINEEIHDDFVTMMCDLEDLKKRLNK